MNKGKATIYHDNNTVERVAFAVASFLKNKTIAGDNVVLAPRFNMGDDQTFPAHIASETNEEQTNRTDTATDSLVVEAWAMAPGIVNAESVLESHLNRLQYDIKRHIRSSPTLGAIPPFCDVKYKGFDKNYDGENKAERLLGVVTLRFDVKYIEGRELIEIEPNQGGQTCLTL